MYFIFLLLAFVATSANAHVMGVDFGSEFIKVAAPHGEQNVDTVLNEQSRRKTDNYIGFRHGERYIGEQAKSLAARFPLLTVTAINQLMGIQEGTEALTPYKNMSFEYHINFTDRHTISVPIADPNGPFTAEELYSMMLSYVQKIAAADNVVSPNSAVITIPFHSTPSTRRAILEAARLSGVKALGFMHSTTAAAFYYGMRRRGFGNRTVTIVIFDIGATHTEAGVYQFTPPVPRAPLTSAFGTLSTLAVLEDTTLGGRALDICLARKIEKEAINSINVEPVMAGETLSKIKSKFSLLRAANKVREILSANSKTPFTVEGIAPDRDFHSTITRETFETECGHIFDRVRKLAGNVLAATTLQPSDIHAFELMGGVARTPKIISDLSAVLGREVDRTLNMDEAASIGAAYYAVKHSPFYRSRSFALKERVPNEIFFTLKPPLNTDSPDEQFDRLLFDEEALIHTSMSITVNRTEDFAVSLFYTDAMNPFAELKVERVQSKLERLHYFKPKIVHPNNSHIIRLQMRVNETGLLEVQDASVIVRLAANVTEKIRVNETREDGTVRPVEKKVHRIKMKTFSSPLRATIEWLHPREYNETEISQSLKKLRFIDRAEERKHEAAIAKNNLEGYIIWAKNDGVLENSEVVSAAPEELVSELTEALASSQIWLEDGRGSETDCSTEEFQAQLDNITALVKKVESYNATDSGDGSSQEDDDDDLDEDL